MSNAHNSAPERDTVALAEQKRREKAEKDRERQRRKRDRDRDRGEADPIPYETPDWRLFCDADTLPQKAGCQPRDLRRVVLKELADNALDAGAGLKLSYEGETWIVADTGPGLDPARVPRLFCVNRPLVSSKKKRMFTRGMLGNGLRVVTGAVAATAGSLVVETQGRRLTLAVHPGTGETEVLGDEPIPHAAGLTVRICMGRLDPADASLVAATAEAADHVSPYRGASSPWWYEAKDLLDLFRAAPADATVAEVCRDLGLDLAGDDRPTGDLVLKDAEAALLDLRSRHAPVPAAKLGGLGRGCLPDWPGHVRREGVRATAGGARIPYVIEAWATCTRVAGGGRRRTSSGTNLFLNNSALATKPTIWSDPAEKGYRAGLVVGGCGQSFWVAGPGFARYDIRLNVVSPHVGMVNDGKEPDLASFKEEIAEALRLACSAAYRKMARPEGGVSVKDAAWQVMEAAYEVASGGGKYPAHARQLMHASRPEILRLTGKDKLNDAYFTQVLLPDFMVENPDLTKDWDVVFDARESFVEPHTNNEVALGTLDVKRYLGERQQIGPAARLERSPLYPTCRSENRFSTILFVEKEGFMPMLREAEIAERFDIAIMSTKGMSNVAARRLLDRLAPQIQRVLVLHDFDVSGFSIVGTLGRSARRYGFENRVPIHDIGLRLGDIERMGLEPEPFEAKGDWSSVASTLRRHGATGAEVEFLKARGRVELNAMPSDVFIEFLEGKLAEHDVRKVVPDRDVLAGHARRMVEQRLTAEALAALLPKIRAEAAAAEIPGDLKRQVEAMLAADPEIPWDQAVAEVIVRRQEETDR